MKVDNNQHRVAERTTYDLNNAIVVSAMLSLTFVIILVLILHVYARCVLRHPHRNPASTFIHRDLAQLVASTPSARPGLNPAAISRIPLILFKRMECRDDDYTECAVCLSMLEEDQIVRRFPNCNHIFHMACIDKWLLSQPTCPICRSDVSPSLQPLDREPPIVSDLTEVVIVTSEVHEYDHVTQVVINSDDCSTGPSKVINASSRSSSSSSFRLSSFRNIISKERSSSSSSIQICEETALPSQVQQ